MNTHCYLEVQVIWAANASKMLYDLLSLPFVKRVVGEIAVNLLEESSLQDTVITRN